MGVRLIGSAALDGQVSTLHMEEATGLDIAEVDRRSFGVGEQTLSFVESTATDRDDRRHELRGYVRCTDSFAADARQHGFGVLVAA